MHEIIHGMAFLGGRISSDGLGKWGDEDGLDKEHRRVAMHSHCHWRRLAVSAAGRQRIDAGGGADVYDLFVATARARRWSNPASRTPSGVADYLRATPVLARPKGMGRQRATAGEALRAAGVGGWQFLLAPRTTRRTTAARTLATDVGGRGHIEFEAGAD